ncbi:MULTISPECIES: hypothetical protein [Acinetobacter]|uniref:hypothetical protein n=1 Tax=Acinetobacter TaxID=469 RepID=UPI00224675C7|nr:MULTISPECIES: hypothetical protein [Acinetobacter]MCX0339718.1 porin family protein [Acinetobacter radioresistens]
MKLRITALAVGCMLVTITYAAPNDLFLQARELKDTSSPLKVTLGADAVNDTIDIFDIRESEGGSGDQGDYRGAHIQADYQLNPQWGLEGRYQYREIDYDPDTNKIHTALLGVHYTPELNLSSKDAVMFRASIWTNQSDDLNKTSATRFYGQSFEKIKVNKPQDWQFQLDSVFSRKLDPMNQINAFASLGYSQVEVDSLNFRSRYRGCLVDVAVQSDNQYRGNLAQPCVIDGLLVNQLEISGNAEEYGIDVDKDLNYDSIYASIGGSWNWRYRQFESQLGYQYQRLWRQDIDNRAKDFGNTAIKDNHTLGLKLSYDITPKVKTFVQAELYQHNFVGQIPFLYNGITASRLDRRYGLATLGVTFHGF